MGNCDNNVCSGCAALKRVFDDLRGFLALGRHPRTAYGRGYAEAIEEIKMIIGMDLLGDVPIGNLVADDVRSEDYDKESLSL